ncbi:FAD-dependent oxidoreductase [Actinomadura terrae]|uniref:FAD-dependent oxidoreductase n=1 Tax=Actinomadura terrae TaxID=604353 RepID=UPI001FA7EE0E|nr:FAD-dependent oxidoreductase [Actinomadura terrae]
MASSARASDVQVDFPFDYADYVRDDRRIGRAAPGTEGTSIAVVGTGGAGLTAAYELLRVGYRPVLYEAEADAAGPGGRRLGGRMYSRRLGPHDSAVVELGCMRFPDTARLLRHYVGRFGLHTQPFREAYDPETTPRTVLDVGGVRHDVREITDLYQRDERFREAHTRWLEALRRIGLDELRERVQARDLAGLRALWTELVTRFDHWSFLRFLRDPAGVGLTQDQAGLLGTAGIATAAWDSFFDLSFVEILRLLLCSEPARVWHLREGSSALAEAFWSRPVSTASGETASLADVNDGAPRPAVTALEVGADRTAGVVVHSEDGRAERFPAVIFTPQLHVLETSVDVRPAPGTGTPPLGPRMLRAIRRVSYWESAKTALVASEPFWESTSLDGVTLTDRLPRAAYTLDYGPPAGAGGDRAVLLLSFTWAQDAMKVSSSTLEERTALFARELGKIHPEVAGELLRQVGTGKACTISWERQRNFRGMCRFSRPGEYGYQWDLFSHFMKDFAGAAAVPGEPPNPLFLAGDDTAWSSGWLDHAMASGLNAAWGVLRYLGGSTFPDNPGPGDVWSDPDFRPPTTEETATAEHRSPHRSTARPSAPPAHQVIAAGLTWDGDERNPVPGVRVVVHDDRVVAVGRDVDVPLDAHVVELPGHTLLPGLIDCHVHVLRDDRKLSSAAAQNLRALTVLRTLLEHGFTTVRDLGGTDLANAIELRSAQAEGLIDGPRLITAPHIISARGGHGDKDVGLAVQLDAELGTVADGSAEILRCVRAQFRAGADWIKFAASGGFGSRVDSPTAVTYTGSEMATLVSAAEDLGLGTAVHAVNDTAVIRAVRARVRSVEHASLCGPETLESMVQHDVYLVPTLYAVFRHLDRLDDEEFWSDLPQHMRAKFRRHDARIRRFAGLLTDSPVRLAFGTDASVVPYADTWHEFPTMTRVGISPLRALRAATSTAADLLRRPDLGRIRPGAVADLVAVRGNPFTDMTAMGEVAFVMQTGRTVLRPDG